MTGLDRRMARFFSDTSGNSLTVALSHGLIYGSVPGLDGARLRADLVEVCLSSGTTGLILSPGLLREMHKQISRRDAPGIFLTVGWPNIARSPNAPDISRDYATGSFMNFIDPSDALAMGADAAHVYMLLGDTDPYRETEEIAQVAKYVHQSRKLGLPVLVEALVRGERVRGKETEPGNVASVARIGMEIGADILKIEYPGSRDALAEIVTDAGDVPVLVLGGGRKPLDEVLTDVRSTIDAGARGIIFGRNIFQADNPKLALDEIANVVL